MPQPRKITDAGLAEIARVATLRDSLPSDKELAIKYGMSMIRIQQLMREIRLKLCNPIGSTLNHRLTPAELDELVLEVQSRAFTGDPR